MFFNLIFITFIFSIPITLGIAILRYRLWDIDFIIRRTLAYGFLTVFLSIIYLAMVTLFQQLAVGITGSAGESSIAIVITTLVIAAIFNPLRLRIQKVIDRRYYRNRYDPEAALNQLSLSIRDQVNVSQLCESLTATVSDTLHPETISIWVRKA